MILLLISMWVAYITFVKHSEKIVTELETEARRIDRTLETEIESSGYLLNAIGRTLMLIDHKDPAAVARVLKAFDAQTNSEAHHVYTLFSWIDETQMVKASSASGVVDGVVPVQDREYMKRALAAPWRMVISNPIEGRISGRWIIPAAMAMTDHNGKFIGALLISIDIQALSDQISLLVKREGISFAVYSRDFIRLTHQLAENTQSDINPLDINRLQNIDLEHQRFGLIAKGSLFSQSSTYTYYALSANYPYVILLSYDAAFSDEAIRSLLWPRLTQIAVVAVFLLSFLWMIRIRIIKPVLDLTTAASVIANGDAFVPPAHNGPIEIEALTLELKRISAYVHERLCIEGEIRYKLEQFYAEQKHKKDSPETRHPTTES